ncbi:Transcriptional repressor NF-X1 [Xylographa bjoerkii]|nr:Transcriptional repressor NF-X1 [Xylographa bjoerkii]
MAATDSVPAPNAHGREAPQQRSRQRWRGPRGGIRNPPTAHDTSVREGASLSAALAFRPASVVPQSQPSSREPSDAEHSAPEKSSPRTNNLRGRGGRSTADSIPGQRPHANVGGNGTRGGRRNRGGAVTNGNLINHSSGREFGGMLTEATPSHTSLLQPDAPEFTPGQTHQQRPLQTRKGNPISGLRQRPPGPNHLHNRRGSIAKSNAPDIATRTHEDIANKVYECPICTSEVGGSSKVWSCKTCWTVFHLTCIKKWSQNEGSTLQQSSNGEMPPPRQWRCPGCNLPKEVLPTTYYCWCEKEVDPRSISGLPPHSCGQTCGKPPVVKRVAISCLVESTIASDHVMRVSVVLVR